MVFGKDLFATASTNASFDPHAGDVLISKQASQELGFKVGDVAVVLIRRDASILLALSGRNTPISMSLVRAKYRFACTDHHIDDFPVNGVSSIQAISDRLHGVFEFCWPRPANVQPSGRIVCRQDVWFRFFRRRYGRTTVTWAEYRATLDDDWMPLERAYPAQHWPNEELDIASRQIRQAEVA